MRSFSRVNVGSLYNAEALEKSVEEMQIEASRRGYAFAVVRPRGDRNFEAHTVSITFAIDEGPRTYIERINIRGNTRTRDYVIRREFDLSEGDAYNRALVDRAERRLKNLDFFKTVKVDDRARIFERSRDSRGRSRRKIDRRLLGIGRLFDHRRRARRGQHFRAQLPRPRSVRKGVGDVWPVCARALAFVCRPYLLDYRVAMGLDLFYREQLANSYISYGTKTLGFSPRLGFTLREDLSLQLRYSIYQQQISLPSYARQL